MKRAAVGDLHISGYQTDRIDDLGLPYRLGLIMRALDQIAEECRKRSICFIDFLGDIINDKSIIYTVAYDALKSFFDRNKDLTFTMISGNHDLSSTGELQKSALVAFSDVPNVKTYIYKPEIIGNISYIPWTKDFIDQIKKLPATDILIAHLGLNEAALQSGLSKVDKVKLSDISKYRLCLLGHYHRPQILQNGNTTVVYPGSLSHRDWNDKNEKKRFVIYDTETLEVEQVFIIGLFEFKEYIVDNAADISNVIQLIKQDMTDGHRVRLKNKSGEKIEENLEGVLVLENKDIDVTNRGINVTQSKDEQAKKFLEIKGIPENERDEYFSILTKYDIFHTVGE